MRKNKPCATRAQKRTIGTTPTKIHVTSRRWRTRHSRIRITRGNHRIRKTTQRIKNRKPTTSAAGNSKPAVPTSAYSIRTKRTTKNNLSIFDKRPNHSMSLVERVLMFEFEGSCPYYSATEESDHARSSGPR